MNPILLVGSVGMPLAMGIGGIIAWRATRSQQAREEHPTTWRDDSLDEWRKERDASAEAERERRAAEAGADAHGEARAERETTEHRHTRMGG